MRRRTGAGLRGCQGELSAVAEAPEGLDAVQRLEFLRFHIDRHADKIEEIWRNS